MLISLFSRELAEAKQEIVKMRNIIEALTAENEKLTKVRWGSLFFSHAKQLVATRERRRWKCTKGERNAEAEHFEVPDRVLEADATHAP